MKDWVQQIWAQDATKCKGYVEYVFPFRNKSSAHVGSNDFNIGRRYSEDVEASAWVFKFNITFDVELIYVILILLYES